MMEIFSSINDLSEEIPHSSPKQKKLYGKNLPQVSSSPPRAFFDGAEHNGLCGCGFLILADKDSIFSIHWNGGRGTNMLAEEMALAGLMSFFLFLNLQDVSIFGDSKVLADYVAGKNTISKLHLVGWLDRIRFFWNSLKGGSVNYIYREQNQMTDSFSKKCLQADLGLWHLQVSSDGKSFSIHEFFPPNF